jgi:hypothetical protein
MCSTNLHDTGAPARNAPNGGADAVQKRSSRRSKRVKRPASAAKLPSAARLEVQREALLLRLTRLRADVRRRPGYRTALKLLNPMFRRANLAARVTILQAANFMVDILEMTPPFS